MGGCCCCASRSSEITRSPAFFHYGVTEEHELLSSHNAAGFVLSGGGLLVDTNLDTSVPDTYRPPPAPIPYETHVQRLSTPSGIVESSRAKVKVVPESSNTQSNDPGSTLLSKIKDPESDEKAEMIVAPIGVVEHENFDDELKKWKEPMPQDEDEEICPTCLDDYDADNPKMIAKCGHHFHLVCILEWLERSNTCAVCDQEMVLSPGIEW